MAPSAFLVVTIFEHEKTSTIKAGINYLIQSHVSILFLMIGFILSGNKNRKFWFSVNSNLHTITRLGNRNIPFFCFFIGFAIKAGFLPFHTWLPHAHPAAPTHISGIMSGVIIKIGIFGILRMLLLIKADYTLIGYFILFISVVSGLYGVRRLSYYPNTTLKNYWPTTASKILALLPPPAPGAPSAFTTT